MTKMQMRDLLREIYNEDGPRDGRAMAVVPPEQYAAMTPEELDNWDFSKRHLMHRVAKAIVDQ